MRMQQLALLSIMLLLLSSNAHAEAQQTFSQASSLFQAGQYQKAIRLFKRARTQGYNPSVVAFNLGVSHYRLAQWHQAEKAFLLTIKSRKLRQIAEYNLGLVYRRLGHADVAERWFEVATQQKRYGRFYNPKLAALAQQQIDSRHSGGSTPSLKTRFQAAARLAYGYDDDVTDPATTTPTSRSDSFIETYAYGRLELDKLQLRAVFYQQDYTDIDASDFQELEFSIGHPLTVARGQLAPSLHLIFDRLNGQDYLDTLDLRLAYELPLNREQRLRLRYRYSDIRSSSALYSYLEGDRHQLRADLLQTSSLGQWRLRYEYETNNRQNLPTENYSPIRHGLQLRLHNSPSRKLKMNNTLGYRLSEYDPTSTQRRKDTRLRYTFDLYGDISRHLELGLQYRYTNNDSSIDSKRYHSNVLQTYLSWSY